MTPAWQLLIVGAALLGSLGSAAIFCLTPAEPSPFADTGFGAVRATRSQLRHARILRRRLP